jgi:hypothetical protein
LSARLAPVVDAPTTPVSRLLDSGGGPPPNWKEEAANVLPNEKGDFVAGDDAAENRGADEAFGPDMAADGFLGRGGGSTNRLVDGVV